MYMYDELIQQLNKVWVEIGASKIHGVGVKAIRDIPKNTLVFSKGPYDPKNYSIQDLLAGGVDPNIINTIKKYYAHDDSIIQIDKEKINNTNFINYLNHNVKPNLEYINKNYITKQNIKKGEELTIDYNDKNYCPSCLDFTDRTTTQRSTAQKKPKNTKKKPQTTKNAKKHQKKTKKNPKTQNPKKHQKNTKNQKK